MQIRSFTITGTLILVLAGVAFAHKGAMGVVKVRMDAMSVIGKNMKSISGMINGKSEFNSEMIALKAREIAGHSAKFPDYFKKETKDGITEASPEIWKNREKFKSMSMELANLAYSFADKAKTAENGNVLVADFKKIGGTCRACHEAFRIKK